MRPCGRQTIRLAERGQNVCNLLHDSKEQLYCVRVEISRDFYRLLCIVDLFLRDYVVSAHSERFNGRVFDAFVKKTYFV